jgi:uncharacterized protein (TIGR02466 family)
MYDRSNWWLTPVWEIDTGFSTEFNKALMQEAHDIARDISTGKDAYPKDSLWDYNKPRINFLKHYIMHEAKRAINGSIAEANELNIDLKFSMGWINVKGPGEYIEAHAHNDCSLTATYYLQTPEDCGDLVILNTETIVKQDGAFMNNEVTIINHRHFKPKESKLVIFPGYAMHEVQKNKSNDLRVSLSTDMQQVIDRNAPNAMVVKSWCDAWLKLAP